MTGRSDEHSSAFQETAVQVEGEKNPVTPVPCHAVVRMGHTGPWLRLALPESLVSGQRGWVPPKRLEVCGIWRIWRKGHFDGPTKQSEGSAEESCTGDT